MPKFQLKSGTLCHIEQYEFQWCASSGKRWLGIHGVAFGLLLIGILGSRWYPEWIGLFQRISFAGTYVWMWLIVLAIELEKRGWIERATSG